MPDCKQEATVSSPPGIPGKTERSHKGLCAALLGATEGADLLVIGRRGQGAPIGLPMGSTARAMIRESRCPVEITPLHPATLDTSTADLALVADELSPQT